MNGKIFEKKININFMIKMFQCSLLLNFTKFEEYSSLSKKELRNGWFHVVSVTSWVVSGGCR